MKRESGKPPKTWEKLKTDASKSRNLNSANNEVESDSGINIINDFNE